MVYYPNNKIPDLPLLPRMKVVEAARTLLGTPFLHLGRTKQSGVDCIGMLTCVSEILGLAEYMPGRLKTGVGEEGYTTKGYDSLPHPNSLVSMMIEPLSRIENLEDRGIGDIEVYWIRHKRVPCHTAILTDLGHIHCVQGKKVAEQPRSGFWNRRLVAAFRYPGIEENTNG